MGQSAAERMKGYRARLACGQAAYRLVLDEVDTAAMLIAGGLLAECDADDHAKVTAALEQQIANLIRLARYA